MANKGFRVVSCVKFSSLNLVQIFNITCAEPEKAHFLTTYIVVALIVLYLG